MKVRPFYFNEYPVLLFRLLGALPPLNLRVFIQLLSIFLLLDFIAFGAHILTWGLVEWGFISNKPAFFDITLDVGLGELLNYGKWTMVVGASWVLWRRAREPMVLALGAVFGLILADDSLRLHEQLGSVLSNGWDGWLGIRAQDYGEMAVWALMGLPVLAALGLGFLRSSRAYRALGLLQLVLLGGLVFVAVVADVVASNLYGLDDGWLFRRAIRALTLLEDGGEMVLASCICALSVATAAALPGYRIEHQCPFSKE